ncbi:hypothetical protein EK904_010849 [Melospiza melodia maxima]|nr:hypothetical protein EK904_010849 [Melospiza melodia maxima]
MLRCHLSLSPSCGAGEAVPELTSAKFTSSFLPEWAAFQSPFKQQQQQWGCHAQLCCLDLSKLRHPNKMCPQLEHLVRLVTTHSFAPWKRLASPKTRAAVASPSEISENSALGTADEGKGSIEGKFYYTNGLTKTFSESDSFMEPTLKIHGSNSEQELSCGEEYLRSKSKEMENSYLCILSRGVLCLECHQSHGSPTAGVLASGTSFPLGFDEGQWEFILATFSIELSWQLQNSG